MSNPVVWFEISGNDPQRLRKFYADVFGWQINAKDGSGYAETMPRKPEGAIGGGICVPHNNLPPYVTVYVQVANVDAALARAADAGAAIVIPKTVVPGAVTFAMLKDPAGNLIGLLGNHNPD